MLMMCYLIIGKSELHPQDIRTSADTIHSYRSVVLPGWFRRVSTSQIEAERPSAHVNDSICVPEFPLPIPSRETKPQIGFRDNFRFFTREVAQDCNRLSKITCSKSRRLPHSY